MDSCFSEQQEELEALQAIYDDDFNEITSQPPCFMIRLDGLETILSFPVSLKVTFPSKYPESELPELELPQRVQQLSTQQTTDMLEYLQQVASENEGMAMVYNIVEAAKEWINTNFIPCEDENKSQTNNMDELKNTSVNVTIPEPSCAGGRWDFVIGLVGKPSAGKSTFFNAATTHDTAKTGAHPFTTIEPNIGKGFFSISCPCQELKILCNAAYGHNAAGERLMPVLLKDVAGLVPGASQGKGRGNRFLNDLLDADVLLHIIDASGCTDEKGEEAVNYDPSLDISWLQQELESWIFENIKDKWDSIKKKPSKLLDMFTGYHASKSVIYTAFQSAGIDEKKLSQISTWPDETLCVLVKHFLQIRFPVFLVLNKCDKEGAEDNITRIRSKFPDLPSLPVSARTECLLQDLQKQGCIEYLYGSSEFTASSSHQDIVDGLRSADDLLQRFGSTNVQQALSKAIELRNPCVAFPVQSLETLESIDLYRGEKPGKLRDSILLKPNTNVEELYGALFHYPLRLVAGDFIRAECLDRESDGTKHRIMKKDEKLNKRNNILRIFTNRKVSQIKIKDSP